MFGFVGKIVGGIGKALISPVIGGKALISGSGQGLDIANKAVDGIINGLDKLKFTEEEKFDAWKAVAQTHLAVVKEAASESTTKSMTRRFLALILIGNYVFLSNVAAFGWLYKPAWSMYVLEICNDTILGKLTLWFGIFYVGYYGVSNIIDHAKKK